MVHLYFSESKNYSGFDRQAWHLRSNARHRRDVKTVLEFTTKSEQKKKESELGCRYSGLLELPYFNPVRMLTVDPMHNRKENHAKGVAGT